MSAHVDPQPHNTADTTPKKHHIHNKLITNNK
jgi:hypothetical protein